jgi:hypothetical protein
MKTGFESSTPHKLWFQTKPEIPGLRIYGVAHMLVLVSKEVMQRRGIDFVETFAPG